MSESGAMPPPPAGPSSPPASSHIAVALAAADAIAPRHSMSYATPDELRRDPKYRKYVQAVDKILQSFDAISEWADLIGFLSRLLKVLQQHAQYANVPRKLIVAKRLAQCLNPALPAGVHQKALEVYAAILEAAGPPQLAEDLPLWSLGLFPFLQHSATSVKPVVLQLYEKYYVTLGLRLKPCLKGLIIAILPGIEEENSEYFDSAMSILDHISESVGKTSFYQSMSLAIISVPHLRGASMNYLLRRVRPCPSRQDAKTSFGSDLSLWTSALASALQDAQMLVQRGALELLVVNFALDKMIFEQSELKMIMMAALSVVLRKDMSLNRRLYSWLLGSSPDLPPDHCKTIAEALKVMFSEPSENIADIGRPYKIMLSLLDKAEIGRPVLDEVFLHIMSSLASKCAGSTSPSEILQTANMLLQNLEPFVVFRQYFKAAKQFPQSTDPCHLETYSVIEFSLQQIHMMDEEVQRVHLPLLLLLLSTHLQGVIVSEIADGDRRLSGLLSLCLFILSQVPPDALCHQWKVVDTAEMILPRAPLVRRISQGSMEEESGRSPTQFDYTSPPIAVDPSNDLLLALEFYGISNVNNGSNIFSNWYTGKHTAETSLENFAAFLNTFLSAQLHDGALTLGGNSRNVQLQSSLAQLCSIVERLVIILDFADSSPDVESRLWLADPNWIFSLAEVSLTANDFSLIQTSLRCLIEVHACLTDTFPLTNLDLFAAKMVHRLWNFLSPSCFGPSNPGAVKLLWKLAKFTKSGRYLVEDILARFVSLPDLNARLANFDRFGVFWLISNENDFNTSIEFSRPLFLILDCLRSEHPGVRRAAEAWLKRFASQSYVGLLDPIIHIFLHRDIVFTSSVTRSSDQEIRVSEYKSEFNISQVFYAMQTLQSLLNFLGRPFMKTLWTTMVKGLQNLDLASLQWTYDDFKLPSAALSLAELLMLFSLRFLKTELSFGKSSQQLINLSLQAESCRFLSALFLQTDTMNRAIFLAIHEALVSKLQYAVSHDAIDLQPFLLTALQEFINMLNQKNLLHEAVRSMKRRESFTVSAALDNLIGSTNASSSEAVDSLAGGFLNTASTSKLIQTVTEALNNPSCRAILSHWIEFILHLLPHLKSSFKRTLLPLLKCLSREMAKASTALEKYVQRVRHGTADEADGDALDDDILILSRGLEKTIIFCLFDDELSSHSKSSVPSSSANPVNEIAAMSSSAQDSHSSIWSFTDYVSSVFSNEPTSQESAHLSQRSRDLIISMLPNVLRIFNRIYSTVAAFTTRTRTKPNPMRPPKQESQQSFATNSSDHLMNVDEHSNAFLGFLGKSVSLQVEHFVMSVFRSHPGEIIEAVIIVWFYENQELLLKGESSLKENQELKLNHMSIQLLHTIYGCTPRVVLSTIVEGLKARVALANGTITVKEKGQRVPFSSSNLSDTHLLVFMEKYGGEFADVESLGDAWSSLSTYIRDNYIPNFSAKAAQYPTVLRLATVFIDRLAASRPFEDKRTRREADILFHGICDNALVIASKVDGSKLLNGEPTNAKEILSLDQLSDLTASMAPTDELLPTDILLFFAVKVVPNLRKLMSDQDRIAGLLTNCMYYIITPFLKGGKAPGQRNTIPPGLELLHSIVKLPYATRTWKKEAWDAYLEPKFFAMSLGNSMKWRSIVQALMVVEKDVRAAELIGRISAVPTASIFVSREQEVVNRSYTLRRLSFVLWCGTMDQYVPQLPSIQEKLVEVLRGAPGPMHIETYLCLRVMMLRMSNHHLANLWPILLTELVRLFGVYLRDQGTTEDLAVFFSACKVLDLLLLLGTEEFQCHQWIFISETLKSGLLMEDLTTDVSLVEKLQLVWTPSALDPEAETAKESARYTRPVILAKSIRSKSELQSFIFSVSERAFVRTRDRIRPDLQFVENFVHEELLDPE
ncbi:Dopey, N-terminal-domain-containing protein [Zopfochytrium polystomum]|nr:Dopey, N-terminal-domain-containing protein [Zopfochytrium polystomum]